MLKYFSSAILIVLAGCVQTDIQPLTQTSFKVATSAAPACGRTGAREVANKAAAIEVIRRGGDRFIIVADQTGSRLTGVTYDQYAGFNTYNSNEQDLVIQMISSGQSGYGNALSARQLLGPDWQAVVQDGIPDSC
jgi:hypothetical protein